MISQYLKPYPSFIVCDRLFLDGKKPLDRTQDFNNNLLTYEQANDSLQKGNNIGFVLGLGTLCIDCDSIELYNIVRQQLPETYAEKTTSNGFHFIYSCDFISPNKNFNKNGIHLGELRGNRQYIVISPSIAKSKIDGTFNKYEVIKNIPPTKITKEELENFLSLFNDSSSIIKTFPHKTTGGGGKKEGLDRSRYDFAKVCELIENGNRSFSDIDSKMRVLGSTKWKNRLDGYRLLTFQAAMRRVGK